MSEGTTTTTTETPQALSVPLNPDGTIGALPEQLQKLVDARIRQATQRAKGDPSPVEAEELRQLRAKMSDIERQEAERKGEYEKALTMRDAEYTAKLTKAEQEVARRTVRLKESVKADIRAAAVELGARKESLPELETLLSLRMTLDEESLTVRVLGDDGAPSDTSVADLVKAYLDAHAHHRAAAPAGGGARGGASLTGTLTSGAQAAYTAALDAWQRNPTAKNHLAVQAARAALASTS